MYNNYIKRLLEQPPYVPVEARGGGLYELLGQPRHLSLSLSLYIYIYMYM